MTLSRLISDLSSDPGGKSGSEWTQDAGESIEALWALNGGLLASVTGTNALVGVLDLPTGFQAYTNGLEVGFIPPNTNTGAASLDLGLGAKLLRNPDGDELKAGDYVAGRFTTVVFVENDDHFRLTTSGGTTNVTVTGGIALQRSQPVRLAAEIGPTTVEEIVASISFQSQYPASRVAVEGNISRVTGAGSSSNDGTSIRLYVDDVLIDSFTDHCGANSFANTPFSFEYNPGDIAPHTYEIRVLCALEATYPAGGNWLLASEFSPNA